MSRYSVAVTKDKLSQLIDKALAGEEVLITRHGKPAAILAPPPGTAQSGRTKAEWIEWLRDRREHRPSLDVDAATLVRQMREDGAH